MFFAPRQEVIDDFMKITGNKAFASNIEELVYDARLFWSYLDGHGTFVRYGGCDLLSEAFILVYQGYLNLAS